MRPTRALAVTLAMAATTGCTLNAAVPAITPGTVNAVSQQLASFAALGLKMLDDAGVETNLDPALVQSMLVGGKEQPAEFDADGNLKVPVAAGDAEQLVEVRLKDGQTLQMPVKAKANEKLTAFVMAGSKEGELLAEVGKAGQRPQDIFRDKTVRFEVGEPKLTDATARAFFIGRYKMPRQSWFTQNGDLRLHGSALFIIAQAGGAMKAPPPPAAFGVLQTPPQPQPMPPMQQPGQPPMQQPGQPPMQQPGQPPMQQPGQPPMPGGQGVVFRLVAEIDGKWAGWSFTPKAGTRLPGPPLSAGPGLLPVFKDLPTLNKADFDVKSEAVTSLEAFETGVVNAQRGTFLPPPGKRPAGR